MGRPIAIGGGAVGVIVVLLVSFLTGRNPGDVARDMNEGQQPQPQQPGDDTGAGTSTRAGTGEDAAKHFISQVLATTEDAWSEQFARMHKSYQPPSLVLFSEQVDSACGLTSAAVGPFYCPRDRKAYLDLTFFAELSRRFGAPGDFAQAYVVAHEIGHHVQNLLGTSDAVGRARGPSEGAGGSSVRMELQADCYAGVWGAYAKKNGLLEIDDPAEAIRAAQAIGDDTLQRRARGRVAPESFTHGTSAQRVKWFTRGLQTGDPAQCDTFHARDL